MNYVRKLGFEESPDYDFLRELFTKVLKNIGEQDDGIFDWMLINNGKGWEAGNVKSLIPITDAYLNRIFPDACIITGAGTCNC
jgi:casein kinase 1